MVFTTSLRQVMDVWYRIRQKKSDSFRRQEEKHDVVQQHTVGRLHCFAGFVCQYTLSLHTSHDIRQKAGLQVTMSLQKVHSYRDIISRENDIKDKHRCEAHRALRESRSVRRVWNFAIEELGRININFDPAWMSGKNIRCTVSGSSNY